MAVKKKATRKKARTSSSKAMAPAKTTAIADYKAELAKYAQSTENAEITGGGNVISTRNGQFHLGDEQLDNELRVIVVDQAHEHAYYTEAYDSDNPAPPDCFALALVRDGSEDEMGPHPDSPDPQSDKCVSCEWNKFGTAQTGRGKACTQRRRIVMVSADTELTPESVATADMARMSIPVTSVKAFSAMVKKVRKVMNKLVMEVYTKLSIEPDSKTQFRINSEFDGEVEEALMPGVVGLIAQAKDLLLQPFDYTQQGEEESKPARRAAPKKKAARKKAARKKATRRKF